MSDVAEFVAGTDPLDEGSRVQCSVFNVQDGVKMELQTIVASEEWYEGVARYYSLERADSPAGPWSPVEGEQDVPASAGVIDRTDSDAGGYYRVLVELR